MYEKYFEDMQVRMKPVLDLAEANKQAMERLASLQKESMTEVVNASVEQFKELSQCSDAQSALDLQLKFYKALEAKMNDTAEKSISAINEVKEMFVSTMEDSVKKTTAEMEEALKKAGKMGQ